MICWFLLVGISNHRCQTSRFQVIGDFRFSSFWSSLFLPLMFIVAQNALGVVVPGQKEQDKQEKAAMEANAVPK